MSTYILHILTLIAIYWVCCMGCNLSAGYAGIISLAYAALFGLGAYATALGMLDTDLPFLVALIIGVAVATGISLLVGGLSLRLQDDYFVVGTIGLQMIIFAVLNNWQQVTRGPYGIPGIPPAEILGWRLDTNLVFAVAVWTCAAVVMFFCTRLARAPFGRVLCAIREDERFAQSLGKNPARFKLAVSALSGAAAGLAGGLYAVFMTFIDPSSFTIAESIFILAIVIIGGAGSLWGPLVGSIVLVSLPEILRFVGLPGPLAGNVRQILYGALLVAMLLLRPEGLMGNYRFNKR